MNNKIFYTINPHLNNYSLKQLIKTFKYILQRYYKQTLGVRYNKQKDKQFKLFIFGEKTFKEITEPHLHIIIEIAQNKQEEFFAFMYDNLKNIYPSLTADIKNIATTKDFENIITYCLKEDPQIISNEDFF